MPASLSAHYGPPASTGVEDAFVAAHTYQPGDEFIQPRNADGRLWLFQVPVGYTGPAGATWDATEEARYSAVGDAPQTVSPTLAQSEDITGDTPYVWPSRRVHEAVNTLPNKVVYVGADFDVMEILLISGVDRSGNPLNDDDIGILTDDWQGTSIGEPQRRAGIYSKDGTGFSQDVVFAPFREFVVLDWEPNKYFPRETLLLDPDGVLKRAVLGRVSEATYAASAGYYGPVVVDPSLSTDAHNVAALGTDNRLYVPPMAQVQRYEAAPAPVAVDLNSLGGGSSGTPDTAAVALVYTPTENMRVSAFTQYLRRFPSPTTVIVSLREGAGLGGTVLATSAPVTFGDTNFVNRRFTFPADGPVLVAGQPYTFTPAPTAGANLLTGNQADTRPEFGLTNGSGAELRARVEGVTVPDTLIYTVTTYTDGVNITRTAANETDPTDIQDVTASIPAGWALITDAIEDTTDGQTLEWGTDYWFHPTFNYDFPAVTQTANTNRLRAYPSNLNWGLFTGNWNGNGTDTVGAGQDPLTAVTDVITFVGNLGTPSNISMHVGGGSAVEVGLPAYVNLADAQAANIQGRVFRGAGTGTGPDALNEGLYYMQANNIPVGPMS